MSVFNESKIIRNKFAYIVIVSGLFSCLLFAVNNVSYAQEQEISSNSDTDLHDEKTTLSSPTPNNDSETSQNEAWEAFVPPSDKFDWIQLTSGEWLKGELKVLYEEELEFDSDELDLLKFDMEDVKQIRGHGIKGVRLEGPDTVIYGRLEVPEPITVYGELVVTEDKVIITSGDSQQEFNRSDLIAIVSGEDKESQFWSAKVSIGLNFTRGNTDEDDLSTTINLKRRTSATRFVLDYLGNYSRTSGVDTIDNNRLNAYIDVFKTRKYFWRPVFGEYFRDPFQNIERRYTIGTGIGYHIINTAKTEWDATVGVAYQSTQFISVEPGEDLNTSTPVLAISTLFETELTKKIDFTINYAFNIVNEQSGSYTHHSVTTLETELTSWLDFDISFVWDRVKNPTTRADGTVPKPDDYRLTFSLGIEY